MDNNVDIFVSTIGESCFSKCLDSLQENKKDYPNMDIYVVKDKEPMCEAFNYMIESARSDLWVQVDSDFVLNSTAIRKLVFAINNQPSNVLCLCMELYDTGRKRNVQGIKIYRTKLISQFRYRNIIDCEIQIHREWMQKGYKLILDKTVVGKHSPDFNNKGIFDQYRSQAEKQRKSFDVLTADAYNRLKEYENNKKDDKAFWALVGSIVGMSTPGEMLGYERDKSYYNDGTFDRLNNYFNSNTI